MTAAVWIHMVSPCLTKIETRRDQGGFHPRRHSIESINIFMQRCKGNCRCGGFQNGGTPKSSILIGCSVINHLFLGTPIYLMGCSAWWPEVLMWRSSTRVSRHRVQAQYPKLEASVYDSMYVNQILSANIHLASFSIHHCMWYTLY